MKKVLPKTQWLRFIEYMKMILDKNNEMVMDTELCVSRAFVYAAWVQNWVMKHKVFIGGPRLDV